MLIDITMPISAGSVFRLGTPPVEMTTRRFHHESEGEYETMMLSLPAHTATHVDLVQAGRRVTPERMIGKGKLLDVTDVTTGQVRMSDVEHQAEILAGDFVLFKTGWSQFVGTSRYFEHPELSPEVVQWLASSRVNAVGIDALGLGLGRRHGEYDRLLARADVLVIENLSNLGALPAREFTVYCFPLSIENADAIPARVVVEIDRPPGA